MQISIRNRMTAPPVTMPVAVADSRSLQTLFGAARQAIVPGLPAGAAWVVRSPVVGDQLWVDTRLCPPDKYVVAWQVTFGKALPDGYQVRPLFFKQELLVVIAVIDVLIALLLPAIIAGSSHDPRRNSQKAVGATFASIDLTRIPKDALWH